MASVLSQRLMPGEYMLDYTHRSILTAHTVEILTLGISDRAK